MSKRKLSLLLFGLITVLSFSLIGCGEKDTEVDRGHHESKVEDEIEDYGDAPQEMPYLIYDDGPNVCDGMTIYCWDAMEFYMIKIGDKYIEFPSGNDYIYLDNTCAERYPDMESGEVAKVVADVHLYYGGESGFSGSIFVTDFISYEIIDYDDLDSLFDIPEPGTTDYVYYLEIFKYEYNDTVYLIAAMFDTMAVYDENGLVFSYDYYNSEEDFSTFFDYIYGTTDASGIYVPDFTEDEILNMTDEQLAAIGKYAREQAVEDVSTPNPIRTEYGLNFEDGYYYVGRYAYASASNEDEAYEIAKEQWETRESTVGYYDNITLIGYNNMFWLYSADFYYNDEYSFTDTMMVYDELYYDVETGIARFEPDLDNLQYFFSYQNMEDMISSEFCIGEYLDPDADTIIFRKYYIYVCYGDYGISDEVNLYYDEWTMESDGKIQRNYNCVNPLKTVEID